LHLTQLGFKSAQLKNTFSEPSQLTASRFIKENDCVLIDIVRGGSHKTEGEHAPAGFSLLASKPKNAVPSMTAFKRAGPRDELHFDPKHVRAAIVTCGGLCPGLNNVIHHIVEQLAYGYGVEAIYGVRGGYRGFHSLSEPVASFKEESSRGHMATRHDKQDEWAPLILTPSLVSTRRHRCPLVDVGRGGA
jgi:rhodanese-related sulfurtransferase